MSKTDSYKHPAKDLSKVAKINNEGAEGVKKDGSIGAFLGHPVSHRASLGVSSVDPLGDLD